MNCCSVDKGQTLPLEADSLTKDLLDSKKCYLLDCGDDVFVWLGRNTSLDERKTASTLAEVYIDLYSFKCILVDVVNKLKVFLILGSNKASWSA